MAGAAPLFRPGVADVDRVIESQPLRPGGELRAPGFALPQNRMASVAIGANHASVHTLMLAVVTAETPYGIEVRVVGGICVPADFHRREEVMVVSVLHVRDGALHRLPLAGVYLRVALPIITAQAAVDSQHRLLPVGVTRRKRRHALLLDEWMRGIDAAIGKRHIHAPVRGMQDVAGAVVTIHAIHRADLTGGPRGGWLRLGGVNLRRAGNRIDRPNPRNILPLGVARPGLALSRHVPISSALPR